MTHSPHQSALTAPRARRLRGDWLLAAAAVLLALLADRLAAPATLCGTLAPAASGTGFPDVIPRAVRDLGLPRDASVAAFGVAATLSLGFHPTLVGKVATAVVFLGIGLLTLVTFAYGVGIVSCR